MPKLLYFNLQGRAQAIRYLLASKGVAFEDQRLTFEEWPAVKTSGTYGEGPQMPLWVQDDGKYFMQSRAILKMLAFEHGYMPENAQQEYEAEWYLSTVVDCIEMKRDALFVLFNDAPTEEQVQTCIDAMKIFIDKVEAHYADGRAHAVGDKITYVDFMLLAGMTSMY